MELRLLYQPGYTEHLSRCNDKMLNYLFYFSFLFLLSVLVSVLQVYASYIARAWDRLGIIVVYGRK